MSGRKILEGLEDLTSHARGEKTSVRVRTVTVPDDVDVKAIRERLGLTQLQFAARFGFTPGTIRNWEQGHRKPEGPARTLLKVIEKRPDVVQDALEQ